MAHIVLAFCLSNCIIFANDFQVEAKEICVYKTRVPMTLYISYYGDFFFVFIVRCFCVQNKFLRSIIRSLYFTRPAVIAVILYSPLLISSRQSSRPGVTDYSTMYNVHPHIPPIYTTSTLYPSPVMKSCPHITKYHSCIQRDYCAAALQGGRRI